MKMKIKRKVAERLRWTTQEVDSALEEFMDADSSLRREGLIDLCTSIDNPEDRMLSCIDFFSEDYKKVEDLICDLLLKAEPCFSLIALFNISDYFTSRKGVFKMPEHKFERKLDFESGKKSFIYWDTYPIFREGDYEDYDNFQSRKWEILYDINMDRCEPVKLKCKFLNIVVKLYGGLGPDSAMFPKLPHYLALQPLIRLIAEKAGYLIFNIEEFRDAISILYIAPHTKEYRENITKLTQTIMPSLKKKKDLTKKRHWFSYVLVEHIIQRAGLNKQKACEKAGQLLNESGDTIRARYYDYTRMAKAGRLSVSQIVGKNGFQTELEEKLKEAGLLKGTEPVKEDSLWERAFGMGKQQKSKFMKRGRAPRMEG